MNTVNPFIKQEAVLLSLITSRRRAEGLLNHVTLEHQIKSFDLEEKTFHLHLKRKKKKDNKTKKKRPKIQTPVLLILQLKRALAGSNLSLLYQKEKKKKSVHRLIVNSVHV